MSSKEKTRLLAEIDLLKNLDHPNIVNIYDVYEDESSFYLVTELVDGRELFDEIIYRKQLNEKEASIIMNQLLSAISYCHA
jgi:calcium-dependent protein kinase